MRYHNITKDDMLNGDGLRVVLWVSGCDHCCKECHNPITCDPPGGLVFDKETKEELFEELKKDYVSGITFSGGDPLHEANLKEVTALAKEIKERYPKKDIWVYTGYEWESVCDLELMDYTDVVVDGRFILAQRDVTLEWKGSPNQRVIDVKKTRARGEVVLFGEK